MAVEVWVASGTSAADDAALFVETDPNTACLVPLNNAVASAAEIVAA